MKSLFHLLNNGKQRLNLLGSTVFNNFQELPLIDCFSLACVKAKKMVGGDIKRLCNFDESWDAHHDFPEFDITNSGKIDACLGRQSCLTHTLCNSGRTDSLSQSLCQRIAKLLHVYHPFIAYKLY